MDVLYREHERLFLILRLQHPWLKWCRLLMCTNCQNHWVLCCLCEKKVTDLWPMLGPVPSHLHQGFYYSLRATDSCSHTIEQTCLVPCISFLPALSGCAAAICDKWSSPALSASGFMGEFLGRPQTGFWIWLQGHHMSKQYWGLLGFFQLTFHSRFQGNKAMPAACLSPNMVPSSRHPLYLTSSQFLPCFCIFTWKLGVLV